MPGGPASPEGAPRVTPKAKAPTVERGAGRETKGPTNRIEGKTPRPPEVVARETTEAKAAATDIPGHPLQGLAELQTTLAANPNLDPNVGKFHDRVIIEDPTTSKATDSRAAQPTVRSETSPGNPKAKKSANTEQGASTSDKQVDRDRIYEDPKEDPVIKQAERYAQSKAKDDPEFQAAKLAGEQSGNMTQADALFQQLKTKYEFQAYQAVIAAHPDKAQAYKDNPNLQGLKYAMNVRVYIQQQNEHGAPIPAEVPKIPTQEELADIMNIMNNTQEKTAQGNKPRKTGPTGRVNGRIPPTPEQNTENKAKNSQATVESQKQSAEKDGTIAEQQEKITDQDKVIKAYQDFFDQDPAAKKAWEKFAKGEKDELWKLLIKLGLVVGGALVSSAGEGAMAVEQELTKAA